MSKTMKVVQVSKAKGDFEYVDRPIPDIKKNEVLVKVLACGLCHSDSLTKEGTFPGIKFPRIPGHEVVGTVTKVGDEAKRWKVGDRVGRGWCGGYCFSCPPCLRGDFVTCQSLQVTGITTDGGYAEYMVSPWEALVSVPSDLSATEAAPLMCAGLTVFNSMRHFGKPGALVAVQGIGGLGHLAVQFGRKMGYKIVAISQGQDKKQLSMELGAHVYLDSTSCDVSSELQKMGGASLIVCTAFSSQAVSSLMNGVGVGGTLLTLGASNDPLSVNTIQLIVSRRSIQGWPSGAPIDAEDTLAFASLSGTKSMVEVFGLDDVAAAYERMMSNKARFRVVLVPKGAEEKEEKSPKANKQDNKKNKQETKETEKDKEDSPKNKGKQDKKQDNQKGKKKAKKPE